MTLTIFPCVGFYVDLVLTFMALACRCMFYWVLHCCDVYVALLTASFYSNLCVSLGIVLLTFVLHLFLVKHRAFFTVH